MAEMKRTILALALLAVGASAAGGSSCNTMDMVDNYRVPQPAKSKGTVVDSAATRTVYRTPAASSTCNIAAAPSSTSTKEALSQTTYLEDPTTASHWSYGDQENWNLYGSGNECGHSNVFPTYPGESPINIVPRSTMLPSEDSLADPVITMHDPDKLRTGLPIFNNGHTIGYSFCPNKHGCEMTADFGTWPKKLRGIDNDNNADEYFLLQFHWHWGSDNTKGSEPRSAADPVRRSFTWCGLTSATSPPIALMLSRASS